MAKMFPSSLLAPSAAAMVALLLSGLRGYGIVCTVVPGDCRPAGVPWAISCAALLVIALGLLGLVARAALASARRQQIRTRDALRPLLVLPAAPVPVDLATLLRASGLTARTHLVALDTPVALCHGLLRPRLLLSTGAFRGLSPAEAEAVLLHERAHLRRRDPLRLIVARALAEALPGVPALARLAAALPVAQELRADRAALTTVGADALAGALLKVGEALGPARGLDVAVGAFGALDARIDQLLGDAPTVPAPSSHAIAAIAALGVALVGIALLAALIPPLWCLALATSLVWIEGGRRAPRGRAPR